MFGIFHTDVSKKRMKRGKSVVAGADTASFGFFQPRQIIFKHFSVEYLHRYLFRFNFKLITTVSYEDCEAVSVRFNCINADPKL